jgi:hypothetical protein
MASFSNGDSWDGGEVENDGGDGADPVIYSQVKARLLIARIDADDNGKPVITQLVRTARRLRIFSSDSFDSGQGSENVIPAVFPMEF